MAKYQAPNGLIDRLFSLFPGFSYENLSEILGIGKSTIGGWKKGVSVPKLTELEKICELTHVDWQWLLTGKTPDIESITCAYFPWHDKTQQICNPTLYEEARHISGYATHIHDNKDLNDAIHAVAALWRAAIDLSAPDPMANIRYDNLEHPDESDYVKNCSYTKVPVEFLLKTMNVIAQMRNDYIEQKFSTSNTARSDIYPWKKRQNEGQPGPSPWPVRGLAAADESSGTRVPDTDDFGDPINPPPGLLGVPVKGDSMSPVILNGQYVLIDQSREGFETDGGIVVAAIREPDADDDRSEPMTGTFVKRCYQGDGIYYFTSINEYSPFSAWIDHCRIWPVIGVWFAGKGKPPAGF